MSNDPFSDDYDFGFTAVDFDPTAVQAEVDTAQSKLQQVESLIVPLLKNLMKNPDKAYIHWPNREAVVQKQMDRILAITRS
jgi:hypothetical protein